MIPDPGSAETLPAGSNRPVRVVAAVLVRDGRILACRRAAGREAAGRWEFPGGKVEAGEDPATALRREITEELGIAIRPGRLLDRSTTRVGDRLIDLSCYLVDSVDSTPTHSTDHDRLCWCAPGDLAALAWAEPDLPTVRRLAAGETEGAGAETEPADVS